MPEEQVTHIEKGQAARISREIGPPPVIAKKTTNIKLGKKKNRGKRLAKWLGIPTGLGLSLPFWGGESEAATFIINLFQG